MGQGGTAPSILVVKSRDDIEKVLPAPLLALPGMLSSGAATAAGAVGRGVGTAGRALSGAIAPVKEAFNTGLKQTSSKAKQSMQSGGGDDVAVVESKPVAPQPEVPTQHMGSELSDNPNISPAAAFNAAQSQSMQGVQNRTDINTGPLQRDDVEGIVEDAIKPTKGAAEGAKAATHSQSKWGAGLLGAQMYAGHRAKKQAELQAEQQRVEGLTEQARSKAGTGGGQVAVSA